MLLLYCSLLMNARFIDIMKEPKYVVTMSTCKANTLHLRTLLMVLLNVCFYTGGIHKLAVIC